MSSVSDDVRQEEFVCRAFYEWFFDNADFGPAHEDVMIYHFEDFEEETGEILPTVITDGYR